MRLHPLRPATRTLAVSFEHLLVQKRPSVSAELTGQSTLRGVVRVTLVMSAISCVSLTTELTVASVRRGCGQQLDGVAVILSGQSGHGPKHADTFWMSIAES